MLYVTKAFLPDEEEYLAYLDQVWQSAQLTNNGPLVQQLKQEIMSYLGT